MDNKRLVIGMVLAMAVVFGWQLFLAYLYKKNPQWLEKPAQPQAQVTTAPAPTPPSTQANVEATTGPTAVAAAPSTTPSISAPTIRLGETPSSPIVTQLGAGDLEGKTFPMQLAVTSTGAGIDLATLKKFKSHDAKSIYTFQTPINNDPAMRPLATRYVILNGNQYDLANVHWRLETTSDRLAVYSVDIVGPAGPIVRARKTYELTDASSPQAGYEVVLRQSFENLSDQPVTIRTAWNGPAMPPREVDRGPDTQIIAGYDNDREVRVESAMVEEFTAEKPTRDFVRSNKNLPMLWAGTGSVYFNAIVRTEPLPVDAATTLIPKHIAKAEARVLNPEAQPAERNVVLTFETNDQTVAPNTKLELVSNVFLGPKQRSLLNNPYYKAYPRSYNGTLVIANNWCGVCTWQWLIDILVTMLRGFHFVLRDWGLAIIALVVVVRLLLHPITKRSQVSMMKMGKMGPEMERLKKKYGDNKDELNKAMMQVYKEQGFTPVLGCLPMLLQMPIWIALWSALQSTFELRQAPFLHFGNVALTWINDLARPDRLIEFSRSINLPFGMHLSSINILPVFLAVVFYLQQKYTPKPPAATPEQLQQQKMMQWMSLLFPIFLYNGPSGLNLYILTSTTIGIIESKRIRDHIKQKEAQEKAGVVIVDAPPSPPEKGGGGGKRRKDEPPKGPKKGPGGWFAQLQARAEQIQKNVDRGRGK